VTTKAPVTVIVPVYRGLDDATRCLESVVHHAESNDIAFDLLVIDDASPDAEVRAYVDRFASEPSAVPIKLLRNEENLGFVKTVNRGLRQTTNDVVILNADTAVTAGWLDRLAATANLPDVATVTPLTNSGSICTLPQSIIDAFELEGPTPRIDECAAFVAKHSIGLLPEVITGVGFCMYTTRESLDVTGLLDEESFGLGYGEEVDWCLRASRLGLRHLVEDSAFVYHRGGGSFGEYQREGLRRGQAILDDRYPFFRPTNTRERAHDPLQLPFAALELGLQERQPERPHVLHLLHSPPGETGGTEKFMQSLIASLTDEFDFSILYPVESGFGVRTLWHTSATEPVQLEFLLPGGPRSVTRMHDEVAGAALMMALDMLDVDAVHIHNLIGHSLTPLAVLVDFPGPVLCSVHDLYLACPNFSLLYRKRDPCGIPDDLSVCARCLEVIAESPMPGSPRIRDLSVPYLNDFRATVESNLQSVDHWVFASQSAADYFLRAYEPEPDRVEIIEHGATIRLAGRPTEPDEALIFDEPLRVAFAGLGWAKKGLEAVNALAEAFRDSSVEFHHFGSLKEPASPEVHAHGPYDNEYLPELLHRAGIQVVLLPGPYAETFGIVMTEALVAGLPVIGARYGALGERIRAYGAGWTIDPTDVAGIQMLIGRLDHCRDEVMRATREALAVRHFSVGATAPRYAALYQTPKPASSPAPIYATMGSTEHSRL
jgi:GT2 family glycosyltransferase/glycosyltransferase involved in cell wall biosynthesis